MSSQPNIKNREDALLFTTDHSRRTGFLFFLISILVHGSFFMSLIFFQDFKRPKPMPPVIQIDLVSFSSVPVFEKSDKTENSSTPEGFSPETPTIKKEIRKIPTIKPDISLKTKPKNLKDLMAQEKKKKDPVIKKEKPPEKKEVPKPVDPDEALEEAKQQLEKKVETQNQDKISKALTRLQKMVQEQDKTKDIEGKGAYAGYGEKGYKPIDLYKMILGNQIEQNWVFNDILARMDQNLEVRILIKILKSGEIRDIIYETKSGNRYLDESAKKAIKKSNPLPQLPVGMYSYDVVVIFTPKGLK